MSGGGATGDKSREVRAGRSLQIDKHPMDKRRPPEVNWGMNSSEDRRVADQHPVGRSIPSPSTALIYQAFALPQIKHSKLRRLVNGMFASALEFNFKTDSLPLPGRAGEERFGSCHDTPLSVDGQAISGPRRHPIGSELTAIHCCFSMVGVQCPVIRRPQRPKKANVAGMDSFRRKDGDAHRASKVQNP